MSKSRLALLALLAAPTYSAPVTFTKDIAPIVFTHCAPCHHPGGIGPFPLLTYQDVRSHASQIADVTRRRYMPPWPPAPDAGDFADNRSLTAAQIRLISDWVAEGREIGRASCRERV